jgi:hypothetical protein
MANRYVLLAPGWSGVLRAVWSVVLATAVLVPAGARAQETGGGDKDEDTPLWQQMHEWTDEKWDANLGAYYSNWLEDRMPWEMDQDDDTLQVEFSTSFVAPEFRNYLNITPRPQWKPEFIQFMNQQPDPNNIDPLVNEFINFMTTTFEWNVPYAYDVPHTQYTCVTHWDIDWISVIGMGQNKKFACHVCVNGTLSSASGACDSGMVFTDVKKGQRFIANNVVYSAHDMSTYTSEVSNGHIWVRWCISYPSSVNVSNVTRTSTYGRKQCWSSTKKCCFDRRADHMNGVGSQDHYVADFYGCGPNGDCSWQFSDGLPDIYPFNDLTSQESFPLQGYYPYRVLAHTGMHKVDIYFRNTSTTVGHTSGIPEVDGARGVLCDSDSDPNDCYNLLPDLPANQTTTWVNSPFDSACVNSVNSYN